MKKLFLMLSIVCLNAFAEASFDQIETLIEKQQYSAAASGLEGIIANHPNSAKAYYAMAQAQAGMGNQEKARFALNKARGLDPDLKFASSSNVEKLEMAITPQVKNIEPVKRDYSWLLWICVLGVIGLVWWSHADSQKRKRKEEEAKKLAEEEETIRKGREARAEMDARMKKVMETPVAKNPAQQAEPLSAAEQQARSNTAQNTYGQPSYGASDPRLMQNPSYAPSPTQTVIHHHSSSNDGLVTGMVLGQMMSNNHHHHETTRVVEREVVREVPVPSRSSSWDTPSTPSRDSSWDDSRSSKSSSWDTPSSSSSSWGSSSSSSSDSSWGSSSSSDSSSSSSSSWD